MLCFYRCETHARDCKIYSESTQSLIHVRFLPVSKAGVVLAKLKSPARQRSSRSLPVALCTATLHSGRQQPLDCLPSVTSLHSEHMLKYWRT